MDPNMLAMLMGGQGQPAPGPTDMAPMAPLPGMSPGMDQAPMGMGAPAPAPPGAQAAADAMMGMPVAPTPDGSDPLAMAMGPGGDMAAGGPMMASAMPTTDPGQLMALLSQMAAQDQQMAAMQAVAQTKMMQAQAIQPVAAAMLQQAAAQASTMDMGGGPVGAF